MPDYSKPLGDTVKRARIRLQLTQNEVANAIHIDDRTVLNIENYKANPKMEILYPLIRILRIDPREVFYPEMARSSPCIRELRLMIEDYSEEEAAALIPILKAVTSVIRAKDTIQIK